MILDIKSARINPVAIHSAVTIALKTCTKNAHMYVAVPYHGDASDPWHHPGSEAGCLQQVSQLLRNPIEVCGAIIEGTVS